ncbi:MAG: aspartate-semialdehyde dehydrogenase [Candidatus Marinimicrobia bacterium]|nr:aspartate-semialdehyde dehydrogenase [bacterium]MCG2716274.1 aspartate-semialdehyde dehydrogenase [Candidatus Neomarinimicrobiota bacterium]
MKIPVGILGATGSVGQKFIQLLENHPWFEITALGASERSAGKKYPEAVNWFMTGPIPENISSMIVNECKPNLNCKIIFSGLDSSVAGEIESEFARAGYIVVSNSRNHRFDPDVPLLIPEVNPDHLELIKQQNFGKGCIVTNPNCSTIGLVLVLKPLADRFGIEAVNVTTMQALSGAGYPGVASLDIIDNVIPYIGSEEEKMESEPLKILGSLVNGEIVNCDMIISAQCNRVAVLDGHTECVSVKLKSPATEAEIIDAWKSFTAEPQKLDLPTAPLRPVYYYEQNNYPQPKLHRNIDKGMAVHIGRLRKDPILDYKFVVTSHNTIRGAAGGAILNAELMVKKEYIKP